MQGTLKRCCGQGDVLSGITATFLNWARNYHNNILTPQIKNEGKKKKFNLILKKKFTFFFFLVGYAACTLLRAASYKAYTQKGRGMITNDIVHNIPTCFIEIFED